jgi:DNA-binding NtrC family response regulator
VELLGNTLRVRDLQSKNGTFYLGARIDVAIVPVGSTVRLGQTRVALLPSGGAREAAVSDRTEVHGILGSSVAMRQVFAALLSLGPSDVPLLIRGESGTGKDLVARAAHALSNRASGPFRTFDCSVVQGELVHSALFGYAKGAFTDAKRDQPGALEEAEGGTLFLDELGELPLDLQPLLLRALEARQFSRVGETRVRQANFRLVCATHRPLEQDVKEGRFRLDLYHRLPPAVITLPPLRERIEDIPLLAKHFAQAQDPQATLSPMEIAVLSSHPWPGNVRELRNSVVRLIALRGSGLPEEPGRVEASFQETRQRVIQTFERAYLESLLARHNQHVASAANESGLGKSYFYKLLALHNLTPSGRRR